MQPSLFLATALLLATGSTSAASNGRRRALQYRNGAVKRYSEKLHESIQARAVSLAARKAAAKPAPKKPAPKPAPKKPAPKPAPKKPAPKPAPKKHGKGKGKFKAPGSSSSSSTWCIDGHCTPMMAAGVAVCS
ncbi:unnamed protein product [Clonostachys rosea f. rosea IK726]|uniref:Uncharacterized protein n=1 Tax=Clonostachys rosea f. rosea IK726 TaxID=1349383 RepID=A0ACA9TEQ6_BIOOC|nr:unnamed protein product [Clonostachys rosea f. rosea IK726]